MRTRKYIRRHPREIEAMKTYKVTFYLTETSTRTSEATIDAASRDQAISFVESFAGGNGIDTNIVLAAVEV